MTTNEDLSKAEGINTLLLQAGYLTLISIHRGYFGAYVGGIVDHLNVYHPCHHRTSIRGGFGGHVGWPCDDQDDDQDDSNGDAGGDCCRFIGGMAPSIMANTPIGPKHGALSHRFIHVCFAGDAPSLRHWHSQPLAPPDPRKGRPTTHPKSSLNQYSSC